MTSHDITWHLFFIYSGLIRRFIDTANFILWLFYRKINIYSSRLNCSVMVMLIKSWLTWILFGLLNGNTMKGVTYFFDGGYWGKLLTLFISLNRLIMVLGHIVNTWVNTLHSCWSLLGWGSTRVCFCYKWMPSPSWYASSWHTNLRRVT